MKKRGVLSVWSQKGWGRKKGPVATIFHCHHFRVTKNDISFRPLSYLSGVLCGIQESDLAPASCLFLPMK